MNLFTFQRGYLIVYYNERSSYIITFYLYVPLAQNFEIRIYLDTIELGQQ